MTVHRQDKISDLLLERRVDSGADFIEDDELGFHHHCSAEFEKLLLSSGKIARQFMGQVAQIEKVHHFPRFFKDFFLLDTDRTTSAPGAQQTFSDLSRRHHHQVFAHTEGMKFMGNLEGPQQLLGKQLMGRETGNVFPVEEDPPAVRFERSRDQIEQGCLASAVWSDKAGDGSLPDREGALVNSP